MDTFFISAVSILIVWGMPLFSLGVVLLAWNKYRKETLTERWLKKATWFVTLFAGGVVALEILGRYVALVNDPLMKHFLPPDGSWYWFVVTETLQKRIAPFVIALAVGIFLWFVTVKTNKYFNGDLFLPYDKYILFMAALMIGWPEVALYLALVGVFAVLYSVFSALKEKSMAQRVELTMPLLLAAPIVIFFGKFVAPYVQLWKLTI